MRYAVMLAVGFVLHGGTEACQEDSPNRDDFYRLVEEEREARAEGNMDRAEELGREVRRRFHMALLAYKAAVEERNEVLQNETLSDLIRMTQFAFGENLERRLFEEKALRRFGLPFLELVTADDEVRQRRYRQARHELREQMNHLGVPEGFRSILPESLRDEDNAAGDYQKAFQEVDEILKREPSAEEFFNNSFNAIKDEAAARAHLERYKDILPLVRAAVQKVEYEQGLAALVPHSPLLIRMGKILRGCALAHSQLGNSKAAGEICHLQFQVASSNLEEPSLISALVNVVTITISIDTLQDLCVKKALSKETIEPVEELLARIDPKRMFGRATQGEACSVVITLEEDILGPLKGRGFFPDIEILFREDIVVLLKVLTRARTLLDKDYTAINESISSLLDLEGDELPILSKLLCPSIIPSYDSMICLEASLRTARMGLAALKYKIKRGGWPATLSELVPDFLRQIPKDPFTGKDFLYREGHIYSIGKNGRDDGGEGDDEAAGKDDVDFKVYKQ